MILKLRIGAMNRSAEHCSALRIAGSWEKAKLQEGELIGL